MVQVLWRRDVSSCWETNRKRAASTHWPGMEVGSSTNCRDMRSLWCRERFNIDAAHDGAWPLRLCCRGPCEQ